jgi:hypothetical protein
MIMQYKSKQILTKILGTIFLFITQTSFAQQNLINNFNRVLVKEYEHQYPELKLIKIPTNYSEAAFEEALKGINFFDIDILAWDLVYTRHPIGVNHNQLNNNRLLWFNKRLPIAYKIPNKNSRIVEQTGALTKPAAAKLFHGFAIYYRTKAKTAIIEEEIKVVDSIVFNKTSTPTTIIALPTKSPSLPKLNTSGRLPQKKASEFKVDEVDFTYVCNSVVLFKEFKNYYDSVEVVSLYELMNRSMLFNRNSYSNCDSILIGYKFSKAGKTITFKDTSTIEDPLTKEKVTNLYKPPLPDSTVLKSLARNNWNASIICTDVTQSMSPFTSQLLLWIKNKIKIDTSSVFYFFNDGNTKRDSEKVIGSTGGIYKIKSTNFNQIVKTLKTAMTNGYGGDAPENNIECILLAQREQLNAKEIIMLADNWVPVRDMELLPDVKVPVRIIVCGNKKYISEDYLTIAYKTKGSIHTANTDIAGFDQLKENDTIVYEKTTYKLVKGVFKEMPRKY